MHFFVNFEQILPSVSTKISWKMTEDEIFYKPNTDTSSQAPANIYPFTVFRVSNRNARKRCEICSTITKKTSERHQRCFSSVSIVDFECFYCWLCWIWNIQHNDLVSLLLTMNRSSPDELYLWKKRANFQGLMFGKFCL